MKDQEIEFKNTILLQEGGTTFFTQNSDKELQSTEQILRKISTSNIGITAYHSVDMVELTIGGYKEVEHTNISGGTTFSPQYSSISTPTINYYNPAMYGYTKYSNTRSVYFKALVDKETFSHVDGIIQYNAFDKVKKFEDSHGNITSKTIFRLNGYYVFGYYNKNEEKYYLRKFIDY